MLKEKDHQKLMLAQFQNETAEIIQRNEEMAIKINM